MTSHLPRLESRVTSQERQMTILQARVEELSEDMTTQLNGITTQLTDLSHDFQASFKQLAGYQIAMEQKLDARFDAIEARLDTMATKEDIAALETRMATKEDVASLIAASESRMLDALRQLIAVIDTRLPPQQ